MSALAREETQTNLRGNAQAIADWLVVWIGRELRIPPAEVQRRELLVDLGLSSRELMGMVGELETALQVELAPTLGWDYPTIQELSEELARQTAATQ